MIPGAAGERAVTPPTAPAGAPSYDGHGAVSPDGELAEVASRPALDEAGAMSAAATPAGETAAAAPVAAPAATAPVEAAPRVPRGGGGQTHNDRAYPAQP